jgi:predicted nucleic acid-binding protein
LPAAPSEIVAVLDACVLLPASLRDTLLRLAETPRLYVPRWSGEILIELKRNLESRWNLPPRKTAWLIDQLSTHFPEALTEGYESLISLMTNDRKDRHVLAAAVNADARIIVTSNLKDFPHAALRKWNIKAVHPDSFLIDLYARDSDVVVSRLREQASTIRRTLPDLLNTLRTGVPRFAAKVAAANFDASGPTAVTTRVR